jgi:hypothetical protein
LLNFEVQEKMRTDKAAGRGKLRENCENCENWRKLGHENWTRKLRKLGHPEMLSTKHPTVRSSKELPFPGRPVSLRLGQLASIGQHHGTWKVFKTISTGARVIVNSGVMGADLPPLGRVKRAFEQRAEDRRLDVAPVLGIDEDERLDFVPGEVDDLGVGEQAAVEMADDVGAEFTPVAIAWKRFPSRRDRPAGSRRDCVKTRSNSLPGKSSMSSANMQNISFMRKWPVSLLVFPGKMAAEPDVGPAARAVRFINAALERVERAVAIDLGRLGLAKELTQVEEVLLVGAALGEVGAFPCVDKVLRGHAADYRAWRSCCPGASLKGEGRCKKRLETGTFPMDYHDCGSKSLST